MLLNGDEIRELCVGAHPLLTPFHEGRIVGVVSYGLTHAGYDLTLDKYLYRFKNTGHPVDPKKFDLRHLDCEEHVGAYLLPGAPSLVLAQSVETFQMPPDLKGHCLGKSTYARCGVIVNTTPMEPGWRGRLTIEISNTNPNPVMLYISEGIAQAEFYRIVPPRESYATKGGKYQDQVLPTPPRMKA